MQRQVNQNPSSGPSYGVEELLQKIRPFFVYYINPLDVLFRIHAYDTKVLVERDIQEIKRVTDRKGDIAGADDLLTRIVRYKNWQPCLLKVLRDPRTQQGHVADQIEDAIENLERGKQDALAELTALREKSQRQASQIEAQKNEIEELKKKLKSKEQQCNTEKEKMEERHRCEIEKLEKKIQSYKTKNENLSQEKTRLEAEMLKLTRVRPTVDLSQEETRSETSVTKTLPVTGFMAQRNCTLPRGYPTIITIENYHTVETNYGGHFNPVTGRYTIPVDGRYHVTFSHDHQKGCLRLHHVKVSDKSNTIICNNYSSPFDKGVRQATHEGVMYRGDTLYLEGYSWTEIDLDNVTVRFSVSYLG